MRVRLFVEPSAFPNNDPNACQDLDYILPLCKRIKERGYKLMLDFHYSDTWADPVAQWIPKSWEGLSEEELIQKVYDYTFETLKTLNQEGATPDFIQTGNEISYGMLWSPYGAPEVEQHKTFMGSSANWTRLGLLINSAISACREECPDAKIIIHTERVAQVDVQKNFYDKMEELGVDYDIIGLSYYPYFHGNIQVLNTALNSLERNFPNKEIMIVETGYPYEFEVPGSNQKVDYPYTEEGQNAYAQDLVDTLLKYPDVDGLFWWWIEYNAFGSNLTGWYNAPLFSSRNGKALKALKTICSFGDTAGILNHEREQEIKGWFDITGRPINSPSSPGIYINDGKKYILH